MAGQIEYLLSAMARAEPGLVRKPGPGAPFPKSRKDVQSEATQGGPAAFKSRPPFLPNAGPRPASGVPWLKKFIPPLALFNDADQWTNLLFYVQPITAFGCNTSNPPNRSFGFSPPPTQVNPLAANTLNLQLQLGAMVNQASRLTSAAENYFGT